MSGIGPVGSRTTSLMTSDRLLAAVRRTQAQLLRNNDAISSGKTVNRPSDAPRQLSTIMDLKRRLDIRQQQDRNLDHAEAVLNNTDQAIADVSDLLVEARSIASSQVGVGSSTDTRRNQSFVIDGQLQALIDAANRKFQDIALFGGRHNPSDGGDVFVEFLGGVRYVGSRENLAGDLGMGRGVDLNSNGDEAFSAFSARVKSLVDLQPRATERTLIADVGGAEGEGVRLGSISVAVDGQTRTVDLTGAESLGDVLARVNAAIAAVDPAAGQLQLQGAGFALSANAGHSLALSDLGAGNAAADLGIALTASGATVAGADLHPRLTLRSTLASLGTAVDWASGLLITQGSTSKVADFSQAQTVQDLVNVVAKLNLGVRMEIGASGRSLDLVSEVSGLNLSIGETAGGSTATDLGLRTFNRDTRLADLRFGLGVANVEGEDDFEIRLHDGSAFRVNIDGAGTVGEVLDRIRAAAEGAGLSVGDPSQTGQSFTVGLATEGNGLLLQDHTSGGNDFGVWNLGTSLAAVNLGIDKRPGAAGLLVGDDQGKVRVESAFSHLIALRDALYGDDSTGITFAGGAIENDVDRLARIRADIGVRAQRVSQQQERSSQLGMLEEKLLGELEGTDMAEAITEFTQLQSQLEAVLRVGSSRLQLSLLDFLG